VPGSDNSEKAENEGDDSSRTPSKPKREMTRREFLKYAGIATAGAAAAGVGGKYIFDSMRRPRRTEIDNLVVIGGGLAGLVAANDITKLGKNVTLVESCHRLGGRLGSYSFPNGQVCDVGTEEWFSSDEDMMPLVEELGLTDKVRDMAPYDYPIGYWKGQYVPSDRVPDWDLLHIRLKDRGIITSEAANAWQEATSFVQDIYVAWVDDSPKLDDYWYLDYGEYDDIDYKSWYNENWSDDESFDWLMNALLNAELGTDTGNVSAGLGLGYLGYYWWDAHYYHLVGGNQQFADALAARIGQNHIMLNSPVQSVSNNASEDGVVVQLESGDTINADAAIIAVPFNRVKGMVDELPQDKKTALDALLNTECIIPVQQYSSRFYNDNETNPFEGIWLNSDEDVNYYVDCVRHEPGETGILIQFIVADKVASNKAPATVGFHVRSELDIDRITALVLDTMDNFWPGGSNLLLERRVFQYDHYGPAYPPRYVIDGHYVKNREPFGRIYFAGDYLYEFGIGAAVKSGHVAAANFS